MRTVYVNAKGEICALDHTDRTDLIEILVSRKKLGSWCDAALFGFSCTPSYPTDADGNQILAGHAVGPFIDYNIITSIQRQYEAEQKLLSEQLEAIIDNDYRLSLIELGLN